MDESNTIHCGKHGEVLGYLICTHVLKRTAKPDQIKYPDPMKAGAAGLGELVCEDCGNNPQEHIKDMTLICHPCALTNGYLATQDN